MAQIISLGGKKYTAELDWHISNSKDYKAEAKSAIKENKDKYKKADYLTYVQAQDLTDEISYGIINGKDVGKSAAALFANANAHRIRNDNAKHRWFIIEETDDGRYWFCGVNEGIVMPATDMLYPDIDGAVSALSNASVMFGTSEWEDITVFASSSDVINMLQSVGLIHHEPVAEGFSEIVSGIKYVSKKVKITGLDTRIWYALGGIVLLVVGYIAYQQYAEKARIEEARKREEAARRERENSREYRKQQIVAQLEKAVNDAKVKAKELQENSIKLPHFNKFLTSWDNIIVGLSLNENSWGRDNILCEYTTNVPSCDIFLTRTDTGTNKNLIKLIPKAQIVGDNATYNVKGDVLQEQPRVLEQVPTKDYFRIETISKTQLLYYKNKIDVKEIDAQPVIQKVELPAIPADLRDELDVVDHIDTGLAKGQLIFTGKGLVALRSIEKIFDENDLIFAKHIKLSGINANQGQRAVDANWEVQADYFIKADTQPDLDIKSENTENQNNNPEPSNEPQPFNDLETELK